MRMNHVFSLILVFAVSALALGIPSISGVATPQPDGSYMYEYTLVNPSPTPGDVWDIFMWLDTSASVYGETTPPDWLWMGTAGGETFGFAEWSTELTTGLGPDGELAGFSFFSRWTPGAGSIELAINDIGGTMYEIGDVVVPTEPPASIPEPASLFLLTAGLCVVTRRKAFVRN